MSNKATGKSASFTAAEREAMKERAKEAKAESRRASKAEKAAAAENDLLAKVAEMPDSDRAMAERIHAIVKEHAPGLAPKTWYGMPAYANVDGKVICFFQSAAKFGARYATFGFNDTARLDDGDMWPTSFALARLGDAEEKRIAELVRKAAS
ncbi:MAG TPA: DUF1801 domain-containing protein [Thermomicrobiales bacterium]|nr:DUF1801 domain-containing protein [Thermomicrobiales bacterium]